MVFSTAIDAMAGRAGRHRRFHFAEKSGKSINLSRLSGVL
jgi:hypothetical protein